MTIPYPLISVIVPARNEEKTIAKCLKAIKDQNYPNKEIIVVSNNSQDKTIEIAKKFTNKVFNEPVLGAAKARNTGAKKAQGSILVFIDADTYMPKGLLQKVIRAINEGYVAGGARFKRDLKSKFDAAMYLQNSINNILLYKLRIPNPCSYTPFVFCKKEDFKKIKGFPEDLIATEEIRLLSKFSKLGKLKFITSEKILTSARRKNYIFRPTYLFFFPKSRKIKYRDNIR